MTLHIVDSGLVDLRGHYFSHVSALLDAARAIGLSATAYGGPGSAAALGVRLAVREAFRDPLHAPPAATIEEFLDRNRRYAADLAAALGSRLQPGDGVLVFSITETQLLGLALWLAALPPSARPWVAVLLRYQLRHAHGGWRDSADLYRLALEKLAAGGADRLILCADSRELAEEYQRLGGLPVHEVCLPTPPGDAEDTTPAAGPAPDPNALTLGFLGDSRPDKGFRLLAEAALDAVRRDDRLAFRIQCHHPPSPGPDQVEAEAALRLFGGPAIRLVDGTLDAAAYRALLLSLDAVVLPYRRAVYYGRSSGIFTEALAAAKAVIVPADTWMHHQADSLGAGYVTFRDGDAASLTDAILSLPDRMPALAARSRAAAPAWRARHNAPAFLNRILSLATAPPRP